MTLATAALTVSASTTALADGHFGWRSDWRRVGVFEYAVTSTLYAGVAVVAFGVPPADKPLWTRPLLMDSGVREALRMGTASGRTAAGTVSDVWMLASLAHPLVVDALAVTALSERSPDAAWQMEVINLQSYGVTMLSNMISKRVFSRERPYARSCQQDPHDAADCKNPSRFRSYYSSHSALSATSAGLVCAHHTHLPIYGGGFPDAAACLASLTSTLMIGALRVASDSHWTTDVVTGHLLGFASGYVLPTLVYYHSFRARAAPGPAAGHRSALVNAPTVFAYAGRF